MSARANGRGLTTGDDPSAGPRAEALLAVATEVGADVRDEPAAERLPLPEGGTIVVVGAVNLHPHDRTLAPDRLRCVQLLLPGHTVHCPGFDALRDDALRDIVALPDGRFVLSTGGQLLSVDVARGTVTPWPIDRLADLHAITLTDSRLLLANTWADELVELSTTGALLQRTSLSPRRHRRSRPIAHDRFLLGLLGSSSTDHEDHFHLNEAIIGHDGHRYALVHHVEGFRAFTHATHRLVRHGDGGVLDFDTGRAHALGLRAPHSLRAVDDGYAVLDSGRGELVQLDEAWHQRRRMTVGGWGRGLAVVGHRFLVGVSATRKRYLDSRRDPGANMVVALDIPSARRVGRRHLDHVEQVWSVRHVTHAQAEALLRMPSLRRAAEAA